MVAFDLSYVFKYWPTLLPYIGITFLVTAVSLLFGVLFGGVLAVGKSRKNKFPKCLINGYITIIRCTPPIILLFVVYYGIPKFAYVVFHYKLADIHKVVFVIITFSMLSAAMLAEVLRGAFEAIPKGQYEAAICAGMTDFQAFRRILLPQLIYIAMPNFGNSVIGLFREGALAYNIGFIDLMGKTNLISVSNFGAHTRELYIGVLLLYWGISVLLEKLLKGLESKLEKGKNLLKVA
jgi:L-cystine transport system permease protein